MSLPLKDCATSQPNATQPYDEEDAVMTGNIGNASPAETPGTANPPNIDAFLNREQPSSNRGRVPHGAETMEEYFELKNVRQSLEHEQEDFHSVGSASPAEMPGLERQQRDELKEKEYMAACQRAYRTWGIEQDVHSDAFSTNEQISARSAIDNMTLAQTDTAMSRMSQVFDHPKFEPLPFSATESQILRRNQDIIHVITAQNNLSAATIHRFSNLTFFQKFVFNADHISANERRFYEKDRLAAHLRDREQKGAIKALYQSQERNQRLGEEMLDQRKDHEK